MHWISMVIFEQKSSNGKTQIELAAIKPDVVLAQNGRLQHTSDVIARHKHPDLAALRLRGIFLQLVQVAGQVLGIAGAAWKRKQVLVLSIMAFAWTTLGLSC